MDSQQSKNYFKSSQNNSHLNSIFEELSQLSFLPTGMIDLSCITRDVFQSSSFYLAANSLRELKSSFTDPQLKKPFQTRISIIRQLLVIIRLETNPAIKKIYTTLINKVLEIQRNGKQPDQGRIYLKNIIKLQENATKPFSINFFCTLEVLLRIDPFCFEDSLQILKESLHFQNPIYRIASLRCIAIFFNLSHKGQIKKFKILAKDIINAVTSLVKQKNQQNGVYQLYQMVEAHKNFFNDSQNLLPKLVNLILNIPSGQNHQNQDMKETILKTFNLCLKVGSFKKNLIPYFSKEIAKNIIKRIIEKSLKITEWVYSKGIQDPLKNQISQQVQIQLQIINQILVGNKNLKAYQQIFQLIQNLFQSKDWKHQFAAIMIKSKLSKIDLKVEDIKKISQFLASGNPLIKCTACLGIVWMFSSQDSQFAADQKRKIIPNLLAQLQSNSQLRVQACVIKAVYCIIYFCSFQIVANYMERLVEQQLNLITNRSPITDLALGVIQQIVQIAEQNYQPYVNVTFRVILSIFDSNSSRDKQSFKYVIKAIETLALIGHYIDRQLFEPILPRFSEILVNVQNSLAERVTIGQAKSIFYSWARLFAKYSEEIKPHFRHIFPIIIPLAHKLLQFLKQIEDKRQKTNTNQAIIYFLQMIEMVVKTKENFQPYLSDTLQIVCSLTFHIHEQAVLRTLFSCLISFNQEYDLRQLGQQLATFKIMAQNLMDKAKNEQNGKSMLAGLKTLQIICSIADLFNGVQIQYFIDKWMKVLLNIDQILKHNDSDDEEKENEVISLEIVAFTLISTFLKKQRLTNEIIGVMIQKILPTIFAVGQTQSMLTFGVSMIYTIIQMYGYELLHNQWETYAADFMRLFQGTNNFVLKAAIFRGIGILVAKTPSSHLNQQTVEKWMGFFIQVNQSLPDFEIQSVQLLFSCCFVTAIGNIIKAHHLSFNLKRYFEQILQYYVKNSFEQEDQIQTVVFLVSIQVDILMNNQELVLELNEIHFQVLLQMFGQGSLNIHHNPNLLNKMKMLLLSLQFDVSLNQSLSRAWGEIQNELKRAIFNLMT